MRFSRSRLLSVLVCLLCAAAPAKVHAGTGIGIEGGAAVPLLNGNGTPLVLGLTFKADKLPFIISARAQLNGMQLGAIGAECDMWLDDIQIGYSIFSFYYGPGVALLYHRELDTDSFSQSAGLFVAPRAFAGISTLLTSFSELYFQAALEPGVVFDEADGFIFRVDLPVSVGLRFWF